MDLKKFVLEGNPVCRKEAVIVGDHFMGQFGCGLLSSVSADTYDTVQT